MGELLQELRVALPGVQVLFAFLLTVPFQQGFSKATPFQKDVYLVSLCAAGVATAFLIAPTAYHRITFRQGQKRHLVFAASRWTIIGLAALAVAMNASVLLVADFLFESWVTTAIVVAMAALYVGLWFLWPLARRLPSADNG
jgi:cytochrome c biogenesis protein CcdA